MMLSKLLGFGDLSKKIKAFILAVTLFFLSLPYGNEPIKVDYTARVVVEEQSYSVYVTATNVGRPYIAYSNERPHASLYKIENGEKVYVTDYAVAYDPVVPTAFIVKNGDVRELSITYFHIICDPGEYVVEVRVNHSDKVYTETITLE